MQKSGVAVGHCPGSPDINRFSQNVIIVRNVILTCHRLSSPDKALASVFADKLFARYQPALFKDPHVGMLQRQSQ